MTIEEPAGPCPTSGTDKVGAGGRSWPCTGPGAGRSDSAIEIVAGGTADDREGFFVCPTVLRSADPGHEIFTEEYFGPILAVFVYEDGDYDRVVEQAADVTDTR
jgi:delta 1-pyrroline-5-carboxylate dehydrogenase